MSGSFSPTDIVTVRTGEKLEDTEVARDPCRQAYSRVATRSMGDEFVALAG